MLDQPLAFVDIETTGGSHLNSRVLEIGVVRVEHSKVTATFTSLVHPDEAVPPWITDLTGITTDQVADAPRFAEIADELSEILDGAIFVAHNVRFDYSFIKMEFDRLGVPFRPQLVCTVKMSRRLFPEYRTHKLADLIARHSLVAPSRHRAFDDAHCLWQFYQLILREFDLDTVEEAIRQQIKSASIPSQLDPGQVSKLTEGPGVYLFENQDGQVLYVGKSVSVRRRVLSHFTSDYSSGSDRTLASQVTCLRDIPTHGELSALLLESSLIKELQPTYNRMLRRCDQMTVVQASVDPDGYATVSVRTLSEILPSETSQVLAVFTTLGRAKQSLGATVRNFQLCPKLMGLEKTSRACFAHQLGRCNGACCGAETTSLYNQRFEIAFARQRVASWPYSGSILITERNPAMPGCGGFVVNGWCLVASLTEHEDGTVESRDLGRPFDIDTYRILRRFIELPGNRTKISILSAEQERNLLGAAFSF